MKVASDWITVDTRPPLSTLGHRQKRLRAILARSSMEQQAASPDIEYWLSDTGYIGHNIIAGAASASDNTSTLHSVRRHLTASKLQILRSCLQENDRNSSTGSSEVEPMMHYSLFPSIFPTTSFSTTPLLVMTDPFDPRTDVHLCSCNSLRYLSLLLTRCHL